MSRSWPFRADLAVHRATKVTTWPKTSAGPGRPSSWAPPCWPRSRAWWPWAFGVAEILQVRLFRAVVGVGVAVFMVGFAALLLAAARALLRLRRWARAPVVVVQLIMLPVGWSFRGGQTTPVAVAMIIVALLTLVLILHPRSTRALVVPGSAGGRHRTDADVITGARVVRRRRTARRRAAAGGARRRATGRPSSRRGGAPRRT